MKENIIKIKSFEFGKRIVRMSIYLERSKKEFVLSKQLKRSGTAPGALVRESEHAESKANFKHKLAIAQKECDETLYWLELLIESEIISNDSLKSMHFEAQELLKLLKSIILTYSFCLFSYPNSFIFELKILFPILDQNISNAVPLVSPKPGNRF